MKKIPTLFMRDADDMRYVTPEVNPACQWVLDGEGVATRKYDGTCLMFDGEWWARREIKPGKAQPGGFVAEETDPNTGKIVGWEPVEQSAFYKAFSQADKPTTLGTYELCGPKVNGNPEGFEAHVLVAHATAEVFATPRDFEGLRAYLGDFPHEGIVWHNPDGRKAKLKVRDFPRCVGGGEAT